MNFTRVTASLLACSAFAMPGLAQGKPFKHALPANTLAMFSMPDLNTSMAEFQNTPFAKMWREDEVQEFFADAMKMGKAQWAQGLAQLTQMHKDGQFPISPDDLLKLRVHSFSGALTSLEVVMGENKPMPKIGFVLHMDLGESAPTWKKLVNMGLGALMQQSQGMFERKDAQMEGIEMFTLQPKVTDMSLNVAFLGNSMVIGSIQSDVVSIAQAMAGQKTILPSSVGYKATSVKLDSTGAEMEVFMNIQGMMDSVMGFLRFAEKEAPNFPEQLDVAGVERAMVALGLRSVPTMGMTSSYKGDKSVTRGFAWAPEAGRKGMTAMGKGSVDMSFLKWVPKDVASVSTQLMDFDSVYTSLVGALKAYNPQMAEQMLGKLAEHEKQLGMTLKDDLFGVFGNQMVMWSMGVQNFMSAPEGALLIKIKDQDRLLKTLNKISQMSNGMFEFPASERKGIKTWRLELNPELMEDPQMASVMSFLQPCFAFKDGYMVAALATGDVRKALKRMSREDDPKGDIRSNAEFAGYLKAVEQQQVSSFAWTDWKQSFENLYSTLTSVLGFAVNSDEVPFDLTLLPEAETLSQHLFSSATWTITTKDGFESTSVGPMGPEMVAGAAILLVGGGAAMFGMRTQRRAPMAVESTEAAPARKK